jgi:serine protease Do
MTPLSHIRPKGFITRLSNALPAVALLIALSIALSISLASAGPYDNAATQSPFRAVAERVVPAVVSIEVTRDAELAMRDHPFFEQFRRFFPQMEMPDNHQPIPGSGSGFLIDADGTIVTNHHVIRDTQDIKVRVPGEREPFKAKVLGADPKTDLAVLRLETNGRRFPFVEQGDSDDCHVGDWAIAVGNPLGELEGTLTVGVISAKGRSNLAIAGGAPAYQDFIQTDAAINFGNSGGPLVDINGRVIGINTAINASGQGIGFAIPINLVKKIIPQLIAEGKVTRAYLGVIPRELDAAYAEALGLDIDSGILVEDVAAGTPADEAGLRTGDIITQLDGEAADNVDRFRLRVAEHAVGDKIDLKVHRDGKDTNFRVQLSEFPDDEAEATLTPGGSKSSGDWYGIVVEDLASSPLVREMEIEAKHGVVVAQVRSGSPAESAGLMVGDVIQKVKNVQIENLEDFQKAAKSFENADKRIGLLVQRKAYTTFLYLTPE